MENTLPVNAESNDVFSSSKDSSPNWPSPSRIHFSTNEATSSRSPRLRPDGPKLPSGLTPPIRRGSPLNPHNFGQAQEPRRRPWPSDTSAGDSLPRHRRNTSFNLGAASQRMDTVSLEAGQEVGVFSDEYDLSHEDPRILQDVQRALKLKARREARLKRETSGYVEKHESLEPVRPSNHPSTPPRLPSSSRPSPSPSSYPSTSRKSSTNATSEVDFSPSIGILDSPLRSHPVPSSNDNGKTLDWTGVNSEDGEKRRLIGLGKKKEKDRIPLYGLAMDQNEQIHDLKLAHIKNHISNQTWRKADITSDQLARRYILFNESAMSDQGPINLLQVAKWHSSQEEWYKKSLEQSEPLTWLRHLERRKLVAPRSPWHLSALIIESYAHARRQTNHSLTSIEDSTPPALVSPQTRKSRSPSFLSSRGTQLVDERISFEPYAEGKGDSIGTASHISVDSGPSSLTSVSSPPNLLPLSPISTRSGNDVGRNQTGLAPRRSRSPGSSSEESQDSISSIKKALPEVTSHIIPELTALPPAPPPLNSIPQPAIAQTPLTLSSSHGSTVSSQSKPTASLVKPSSLSLKAPLRTRRGPRNDNSRPILGSKKRREERENALKIEYETKHRLLQETVAHNNRTRQFLNRISMAMKDFDSIQNTAMHVQGLPRIDIPRDLLEAFGHDPAAVTGQTRRDRGWRAVEDINNRIQKQRAAFRAFFDSYVELPPGEGCLLDGTIESIVEFLESLEQHKIEIAAEEENVSSLLSYIQHIHTKVKDSYHATMSLVSSVYPELSIIIALEESYKDQYQQFWELGMDALTLLLDTVTPFWRTYGKTIGEDVRDFLIIPLYRNEFTGEPKSYPIRALPRRSSRHWLGLVLFFILSIAVNILQFRAAMSSTLHFRLHLIPYDGVRWTALPFFWVGIVIQWLAVIFEFAIVLFQIAVIAWWTGWYIKLVS
ncbi:hypothetical protein D9613_002205 [Agrocybe pediades]|uniref:Uncharacterized protein n=1 Tax=Agrocybe pediades TaxID=84607 RepID=A0A8H4R7B5_9AGAR|nr:hypothetical protein D9613_002205 [Agrocybe pediades]